MLDSRVTEEASLLSEIAINFGTACIQKIAELIHSRASEAERIERLNRQRGKAIEARVAEQFLAKAQLYNQSRRPRKPCVFFYLIRL